MQVQMGTDHPLSTLVYIRMRVVAEDPNLEPDEQGIATPLPQTVCMLMPNRDAGFQKQW